MKTISLKNITSFLDKELALAVFPQDESANGLQVEGSKTIKKIGIAVDACDYVFKKASENNVDFLFVHHGLIWGGLKNIRGFLRRKVTPFGTGAKVDCPKEYLGKDVYLVIVDDAQKNR